MIYIVVVLGLTTVLGVSSEYNCSHGPPPCIKEDLFPNAVLHQYIENGKPLPSNELVKAACPPVIQIAECIRDSDAVHCLVEETEEIDFVALYNSITELCNEESDIRKGYAAHVDCINNMNTTLFICSFALEAVVKELGKELRGALEEKGIPEECFFLHIAKSCAVEMVEDSCGAEAGKTINAIMNAIENIVRCSESNDDISAEVLNELRSKTADNLV